MRQSLDELVAIALFWPILTPTRRVDVNSIFVAVIDTNELVAIDTALVFSVLGFNFRVLGLVLVFKFSVLGLRGGLGGVAPPV